MNIWHLWRWHILTIYEILFLVSIIPRVKLQRGVKNVIPSTDFRPIIILFTNEIEVGLKSTT